MVEFTYPDMAAEAGQRPREAREEAPLGGRGRNALRGSIEVSRYES